jgi:hypothetical protein
MVMSIGKSTLYQRGKGRISPSSGTVRNEMPGIGKNFLIGISGKP